VYMCVYLCIYVYICVLICLASVDYALWFIFVLIESTFDMARDDEFCMMFECRCFQKNRSL
jgi:hypothetical protein